MKVKTENKTMLEAFVNLVYAILMGLILAKAWSMGDEHIVIFALFFCLTVIFQEFKHINTQSND